jgi:hypothetical protein
MMYASWPRCYAAVARGSLTQERAGDLEKPPAFDPLTARSARENGTLFEFLSYPAATDGFDARK